MPVPSLVTVCKPEDKLSYVKIFPSRAEAELAVRNVLGDRLETILTSVIKAVLQAKKNNQDINVNDFIPDSFSPKSKEIIKYFFNKNLIRLINEVLEAKKNNQNIDFNRFLSDSFSAQSKKIIIDFLNKYLSKPSADNECAAKDIDDVCKLFAQVCIKKLDAEGIKLLNQGSTEPVFFMDEEFIRALKPDENENGICAERNKNLRFQGSANSFKDRRNVVKKVFDSLFDPLKESVPLYSLRVQDIQENQICWNDGQCILFVYEKKANSKVGEQFYAVLKEAIEKMKEEREKSSTNDPNIQLNIGYIMRGLFEKIADMENLVSFNAYFIDEDKNEVLHYRGKTNTLDEVGSALRSLNLILAPVIAENKITKNYHTAEKLKRYLFVFLKTMGIMLMLFGIVLGIAAFISVLTPVPFSLLIAGSSTVISIFLVCYSLSQCKKVEQETPMTLDCGETKLISMEEHPDWIIQKLCSAQEALQSGKVLISQGFETVTQTTKTVESTLRHKILSLFFPCCGFAARKNHQANLNTDHKASQPSGTSLAR